MHFIVKICIVVSLEEVSPFFVFHSSQNICMLLLIWWNFIKENIHVLIKQQIVKWRESSKFCGSTGFQCYDRDYVRVHINKETQ